MSDKVEVRAWYEKPCAEFPLGSYKETVGGVVTMACGRFSGEGPPSYHWHGGPPFTVFELADWPWEVNKS